MKGWISRLAKFRNLQHLASPLILNFALSHYLSEENVTPAQGRERLDRMSGGHSIASSHEVGGFSEDR